MPRFHSAHWLVAAALLVSCSDPRDAYERDTSSGTKHDAGHTKSDGGTDSDGGELSCEPNTSAECSCGAQSGRKICNEEGTGYGECQCAESCSNATQTVTGSLQTNKGIIDFTGGHVTMDLRHARDVDPIDGGCIARLWLDLTLGDGGCRLTVHFGSVSGMTGGLTNVTFEADSFCPSFSNVNEGTYVSNASYGPYWFADIGRVGDPSAASWCFENKTIGLPTRDIVLYRTSDNAPMIVNLQNLAISGSMESQGDSTLDCVTATCGANGTKDDGTGWCSNTCASGYHDNGQGKCVTSGCSPGFHDDGTGRCVTSGCAPGYHDGGNGSCYPNGSCAPDFVKDSQGRCVRCVYNSQCNDGEICQGNQCTKASYQCTACTSDANCGSNATCRQWTSGAGACAETLTCPAGYAPSCTFNIVCIATLYSYCECVRNTCLRSCSVDTDCPAGSACSSESVCEPFNGCP